MADNFYWLISITSDSARVSLVNGGIISQGQEINWDRDEPDSLLKAVDTSLSSQNSEATSNCAFIVPPGWISEDGKIFPEMLQDLKYICTKLKLRPTGFISYDDAFVESYNHDDSFPSSFVLVYFTSYHYYISLVYLGVIKKRLTQDLGDEFSVSQFEETLSNLEFSSALPPQIIVTGTFTPQVVEDLKNYNWLGRKDIETFLHLPDVTSIDLLSLDQIFVETIQKQVSPPPSLPTAITVEPVQKVDEVDAPELSLVDAESLGFSRVDEPLEISPPATQTVLPSFKKNRPSFSFPKLSMSYYWLLPLTLLPFLPVIPLYFSKVNLTIYQTQVEFKETFDITLSPGNNVSSKTFDLGVGISIPTTGKKEIGNKAKGDIIVFNKLDHSVTINKGLVVTDSSGKKFETTNSILLPGSSYNLDTGTITMGQVKATVAALGIGPEYNLAGNLTFTVKDNPNVLAKSSSSFSGGTRDDISVVTQADKNKLLDMGKNLLKEQAKKEINSQKSPENSILESTMVFDNQRTIFNREVGEESDILSLDLKSKVSFLYFDLSQKQKLISSLFPQRPSLASLDKDSSIVSLNYIPGKLTLSGLANPAINLDNLKAKLVGKPESQVKTILNTLPHYYNFQLDNSLSYINLLRRLPVKPSLINITVKN